MGLLVNELLFYYLLLKINIPIPKIINNIQLIHDIHHGISKFIKPVIENTNESIVMPVTTNQLCRNPL